MINQTTLPTESEYPDRSVLWDESTSWDVGLDDYAPPISPAPHRIFDLLIEQGVGIGSEKTLRRLATLSTPQAIELVGPAIAKIRHPLGRTGINGTGIFWHAGESVTVDGAILRRSRHGGARIALAFSRRWGLSGGFLERDLNETPRAGFLREINDEVGLDISSLDEAGLVATLVPKQPKPNSRRSVDLGYISNQVEVVILPDDFNPKLTAGGFDGDENVEAAAWFSAADIEAMWLEGKISKDHYGYALAAFAYFSESVDSTKEA